MPKDVLHVVISDLHTGSNHALFLGRDWQGLNGLTHTPRSWQVETRKHWEWFAENVKEARKGKQIKLIIDGDAIDGNHHESGDVCTTNPKEQSDIHIEIMTDFQKRIKWQAGDELYYIKGTLIHVGDWEDYIGKELNAVPDGDFHAWDFLPIMTNGVLVWCVHHGTSPGKGPNEGNTLRNFLKNIYYDSMKDGTRTPDIVYTGHVHQPTYATYVYRERMQFKAMHGVILPSWQQKTRYAYMRAPVSKNRIGGVIHEIKGDGTIATPKFFVME